MCGFQHAPVPPLAQLATGAGKENCRPGEGRGPSRRYRDASRMGPGLRRVDDKARRHVERSLILACASPQDKQSWPHPSPQPEAKMADRIPETPFALISGNAGWGVRFPDELDQPGIAVVARGLVFETPWGAADNWQ